MRIILIALAMLFVFLPEAQAASSPDVIPLENISELDKQIKKSGSKIILINIWGITCSPCLAEMPIFVRIYNQFKDNKNVSLLGLCIPAEDSDKKTAISHASLMVHKKQLEYSNYVWIGKSEPLIEKFPMQGTPYTALLKSDGSVIKEIERLPKDPEKAVEFLMNEINNALKHP